jgi:hypothetical protein
VYKRILVTEVKLVLCCHLEKRSSFKPEFSREASKCGDGRVRVGKACFLPCFPEPVGIDDLIV